MTVWAFVLWICISLLMFMIFEYLFNAIYVYPRQCMYGVLHNCYSIQFSLDLIFARICYTLKNLFFVHFFSGLATGFIPTTRHAFFEAKSRLYFPLIYYLFFICIIKLLLG